MSVRILLFLAGVIGLYLVFFTLSRYSLGTKPDTSIPSLPRFYLPLCDSNDKPLLLTNTNAVVCKDEKEVYLFAGNKKHVIFTIKNISTFFPGSLGFLVYYSDAIIRINKINSNTQLEELTTISLGNELIPQSVFFSQNDKGETVIFVTCQKEAQNAESTKTKIFKIIFSQEGKHTSTSEISLRNMLKVVDIYEKGELLLLREMHPFLEKKLRRLNWKNPQQIITDYCQYEYGIFTMQHNGNGYCKSDPLSLISATTGELKINSESDQLHWQSIAQSATPTSILSSISTEGFELLARYSTSIGKRVYNCFDFSETSQITLRACIPEL